MNQKNVLLLGNGLNNIEDGYTWTDLVKDLVNDTGVKKLVNVDKNKPFPLLYEEIYLNAARENGMKERSIKELICSKIREMKPNILHQKIMRMQFENILTTNYDHNLERASGNEPTKMENQGIIKEGKYSLFRVNQIGKTTLWHIHGECNSPSSITLGYDQYSGCLQKIRNYVVTGTDRTYKLKFASLLMRFKKNEIHFDSWIDYFFKKDIYIMGLKLDFVEMHLWWLLTIRARWKLERKINLKNKITYFYPGKYETDIKHKLELLRSVEVLPVKMGNTDDEKYYLDVLRRISE